MSRRSLLAGGVGMVVLSACSSSANSVKHVAPSSDADFSLMPFFDQNSYLQLGSAQRACFGLGDRQGALLDDTPDELVFTWQGETGKATKVRVARHNEGLPRAYYPVRFTPEAAGTYTLTTTYRDQPMRATVVVNAAGSDPVPGSGQPMPKLATPTLAEPLGIAPICTRDPVCPLHDVSLETALGAGKPVAFLVSTPKFCQVAICGPVLEVLLAAHKTYGDRITFIHQEVYQSATEAAEKGAAAALAPAVTELKLPYEPSLFLVGADGDVTQRLDLIYDAAELRKALDALVA